MSKKNYITSSCVISDQVVYKNGTVLFENKALDASGFLTSFYQFLKADYAKFYKMDNLSKLGWLAAEGLIDKDNLRNTYPSDEIGVIISNSNSSLDVDIKYYESAKTIASPSLFVYTLPNIMIGEICIRHGIKGENGFFISPQFDAAFIEQYVTKLINNNILQACICGWVEFNGNDYKGMLLLIENGQDRRPANTRRRVFNVENINKIYQLENG